MENYLASLHVKNFWKNIATAGFQEGTPNVTEEEKMEEELDTSEADYTPASHKLYASPESVQHLIEAALYVHNETKLQRLFEDTVNKIVHHLFKDALEKTLPGRYTKLY